MPDGNNNRVIIPIAKLTRETNSFLLI
jgi:hypothetical protein